jgi:hypothetical protein
MNQQCNNANGSIVPMNAQTNQNQLGNGAQNA